MHSLQTFLNLQNGRVRIHSDEFKDLLALVSAEVSEALGEMYAIDAQVLFQDPHFPVSDLIDKFFAIELDTEFEPRYFGGVCVDVKVLQFYAGNLRMLQLHLRPPEWKMKFRVDTRLFVDQTPMDVARDVLKKAGLSDIEDECTTDECGPSELIVQYNESDLNFVSRLFEDGGRYYLYRHEIDRSILVLCDSPDCHVQRSLGDLQDEPVDSPSFDVIPAVYNLHTTNAKQTKHFKTTDYDFTKINADLSTLAETEVPPGEVAESYTYPGGYAETADGTRRMDLAANLANTESFRLFGESNVIDMAIGCTFGVKPGPGSQSFDLSDMLVVRTQIRIEGDAGIEGQPSPRAYVCAFEAVPAGQRFQAARVARRPIIAGVQTAEVVGPKNKEIHTDEYGRVKVQFHWDRVNKKNENSSCWIRVATPWAGRGWGAITVPRIGMEVIVQFEDGNPDRPIITGMLFNAKNMPPNGLPAAASKMGMKSNSTPGGGGANEFLMEDKKDAEMITMIGERDYTQTIKNDAHISIGYEKGEPGSYTLNVHQDRIENVSNGDYNLGVDTGNRTTYVKTDDTVTVDGSRKEVVKATLGSEAKDITMNGKTSLKIESPDVNINGKTKTKIGSAAIEVDGTTIKIAGKTEILLSVGGSTVKLDASGVTIAGPLVKIN